MLRGGMRVFGVFYPTYRLFVLVTGIVVFAGLWGLLNHTRLGALIAPASTTPRWWKPPASISAASFSSPSCWVPRWPASAA
ncbi:MAG: hypothetical protein WDN50_10935 [Bradyrhizobium sp.]